MSDPVEELALFTAAEIKEQKKQFQEYKLTDEYKLGSEKAWREIEIKKEIEELDAIAPLTITERASKKSELESHKKELSDIKAWFADDTQNSNDPAKKKHIPDEDRITSTGTLNQAIEKMYRHYYDKGEYDFIKPDYIDAFIQKMNDLIKKENITCLEDEKELINYLAERIKTVKKSYGAWKITTEDRSLPARRDAANIASSDSYDIKDVTKKLCLLRIKYPIPCTIPIP